jgi:uncharacterized protein (TIGR00725 family)
MTKIIVGVMGAGDQATQQDVENAYRLGQHIASEGWVVLSGGRNAGVMDAVSKGAKSRDGLTIGILPHPNSSRSDAIDIPIVTDMGNARNNINVLSSRVVIACGMGVGTASEIALALKARKPVILLTEDVISQTFFQQLGQDLVFVVDSVEAAIAQVKIILQT